MNKIQLFALFFTLHSIGFSQTWGPVSIGTNVQPNGMVSSMEIYNNDLYFLGDYTLIGGIVSTKLAKWNGNNWTGIDGSLLNGCFNEKSDMLVHNNKLYIITGCDNSVYTWDGTSLTNYPIQDVFSINSMIVFNNELLLGTSDGVLQFNGGSYNVIDSNFRSNAFAVHNNELYSGGTYSGGMVGNWGVYKFVNNSFINISDPVVGNCLIYALQSFNGKLYAAGDINSLGGIAMSGMGVYDGSNWTTTSATFDIQSLFSDGDQLYVGLRGTGNVFFNGSYGEWVITYGTSYQGLTSSYSLTFSDAIGIYDIITYQNQLYTCGDVFWPGQTQGIIHIAKLNGYATSVEEQGNPNYKIYPNPTNSAINIENNSNFTNSSYYLLDQIGNIIQSGTIDAEKMEIDLSRFAEGVYWLKFDNSLLPVQKIIKE